jgi:hypothetical protein
VELRVEEQEQPLEDEDLKLRVGVLSCSSLRGEKQASAGYTRTCSNGMRGDPTASERVRTWKRESEFTRAVVAGQKSEA